MYRKFEVQTCGFEICEWRERETNKEIYRHADRNTLHPRGESNYWYLFCRGKADIATTKYLE